MNGTIQPPAGELVSLHYRGRVYTARVLPHDGARLSCRVEFRLKNGRRLKKTAMVFPPGTPICEVPSYAHFATHDA